MLDPSRNSTVYYKPVLQTDRTEKKERKLYGNSNRENLEHMLALTGMQAKQTPDIRWTMAFSAFPVMRRRDTGHNLDPGLNLP